MAWWQKRLGWSYDIKVTGTALRANEMQVSARCWPRDRRAFDFDFDVATVQDLDTNGVRELVIHELGHVHVWPIADDATKGMSDKQREEWVERVEEPVVTEWARVMCRLALGKWSQR